MVNFARKMERSASQPAEMEKSAAQPAEMEKRAAVKREEEVACAPNMQPQEGETLFEDAEERIRYS